MTGQLARTPEVRHAGSEAPTLRYVVIVARDRPDLFDELTERFRNSPDTSVVIDQRSERAHPPTEYERRRAIDARLWVDGYVIVRS
jgi:hypothetical protein